MNVTVALLRSFFLLHSLFRFCIANVLNDCWDNWNRLKFILPSICPSLHRVALEVGIWSVRGPVAVLASVIRPGGLKLWLLRLLGCGHTCCAAAPFPFLFFSFSHSIFCRKGSAYDVPWIGRQCWGRMNCTDTGKNADLLWTKSKVWIFSEAVAETKDSSVRLIMTD